MYLQEILEVAAGLVFMWLVMSIAAMSFQEWIGSVLESRANTLESTIRQMLGTDELTQQLYNHPLVSNLYQKVGKKVRLPSYIPAKKFALALFDVITQAGTDASPIRLLTNQIHAQLAGLGNPDLQKLAQDDWYGILETEKQLTTSPTSKAAVDSLKAQIQAYAGKYPEVQPVLKDTLPQLDDYYRQLKDGQPAAAAGAVDKEQSMRQLHLGLLSIEKTNTKLKDSISAVLRSTEAYTLQGDQALAAARTGIETWFDDAMVRLSGTYKRSAQLAAFVIGFVLALLLNVDSIQIATSLWREPTLRLAIVAEAQAYTQKNTQVPSTPTADGISPIQSIPQLQTQLQALNIPFGWSTLPVDTAGMRCYPVPFVANTVWGIPSRDSQGAATCKQVTNLPIDLTGWLTKLIGFAITAAATAQGAPFWFDILKKIINVRSAGINQDEKKPVG